MSGIGWEEKLNLILKVAKIYDKDMPYEYRGLENVGTFNYFLREAFLDLIAEHYDKSTYIFDAVFESFIPDVEYFILEYLIHYGNLALTDETKKFAQNVVVAEDKIKLPQTAMLLLAYVNHDLAKRKIEEIELLISNLNQHNQDFRIDNSKKTENLNEYMLEHDSLMAKLFLFFPHTDHATAWVMENVRQHGFKRLSERLNLLSSLSINDILWINNQLSYLQPGQISQGFIFNLISISTAFTGLGGAVKDVWMEEMRSFSVNKTESSQLQMRLSKLFLVNIAKSLGIDQRYLDQINPEQWNLKYVPQLMAAQEKLSSDLEFKTLFEMIIKSGFEDVFSQMISPEGPPLKNYSQKELELIEVVRRANAYTLQRFSERGLNWDKFEQPEYEIEIMGGVSAEKIITDTLKSFSESIDSQLVQILNLNLGVDIVAMAVELRKDLDSVEEQKNDLLAFLSSTNSTATKENRLNNTILSKESQKEILKILRQSLVIIKRGRDEVLDPRLPKKTRSMLGKCLKSYRDGDSLLFASGMKNVDTFQELLEDADFVAALGEPNLKKIRNIIPRNESSVLSVNVQKGSASKPDIRPALIEIARKIAELVSALKNKITPELDFLESSALSGGIKMCIDHLNGTRNQIDTMCSTIRNAKNQNYHLVVRRLSRKATALFFGNELNCCVSMGGLNGFSMLAYLLGYDVALYEVCDANTNETVGGSFNFVIEDIHSTPEHPVVGYCIDNIELNSDYAFVARQVRDALFELASKSFDAMIDGGNATPMGVFLGMSYNDIPVGDLKPKDLHVRLLGGGGMGLGAYSDAFLGSANHIGPTPINPHHFHRLSLHTVKDGALVQNVEKRTCVNTSVHVIDLDDEQARTDFAEKYMNSLIDLENEAFGSLANLDELKDMFFDAHGVRRSKLFFYQLSGDGRLIAASYGVKRGEDTFYIESTAVSFNYQNRGVGSMLNEQIEKSVKQLGHSFLERTAMADTGYAQRLIKRYLTLQTKIGKKILVYPNLNNFEELSSFLKNPGSFSLTRGFRSQIFIKVNLQQLP